MTDHGAGGPTRTTDEPTPTSNISVEVAAGLAVALAVFVTNVALGAAWLDQDPGNRPLGSLAGTAMVFVVCVVTTVIRPRLGMSLGLGLGALWVVGLAVWEPLYSGGDPWGFGLRGLLAYGANLPTTAAATATVVTASSLILRRRTNALQERP